MRIKFSIDLEVDTEFLSLVVMILEIITAVLG